MGEKLLATHEYEYAGRNNRYMSKNVGLVNGSRYYIEDNKVTLAKSVNEKSDSSSLVDHDEETITSKKWYRHF